MRTDPVSEPAAAGGVPTMVSEAQRASSAVIEAGALECEFATKGGGLVRAVGPIDFELHDRQFVCIVGPSGCGKSTLLRIIAGLTEPTRGRLRIRLAGSSTASPIAMVFQDYGIYPWKDVERNIGFGLEIAGVPAAERRERVARWLHALRLDGFERAYPHELSGGMRQRVAIARALAVEPEVLVMDEPFGTVDPQLRVLLQDEVLRLWQHLHPFAAQLIGQLASEGVVMRFVDVPDQQLPRSLSSDLDHRAVVLLARLRSRQSHFYSRNVMRDALSFWLNREPHLHRRCPARIERSGRDSCRDSIDQDDARAMQRVSTRCTKRICHQWGKATFDEIRIHSPALLARAASTCRHRALRQRQPGRRGPRAGCGCRFCKQEQSTSSQVAWESD